MGWFPGYAIDIQTGERLNIIFAEDSWLTNENGNDMIWNPTSNIVTSEFPQYDPTAPQGQQFSGEITCWEVSTLYILRGESWVKGTEDYISGDYLEVDNCPNYDEGAWAYAQLSDGVYLLSSMCLSMLPGHLFPCLHPEEICLRLAQE